MIVSFALYFGGVSLNQTELHFDSKAISVSRNSMDMNIVFLSNMNISGNTLYIYGQQLIGCIQRLSADLYLINTTLLKPVSVSTIFRTSFSFSHIRSSNNSISNMISLRGMEFLNLKGGIDFSEQCLQFAAIFVVVFIFSGFFASVITFYLTNEFTSWRMCEVFVEFYYFLPCETWS